MSYLDGQIMQSLLSIQAALAQPTTVHGVMADILQELQQLRIAVSEAMDIDLGKIDVRDYSPTSREVGEEHSPSTLNPS